MESEQFITQIRLPSQLSGPHSATQSERDEAMASSRRNPTLAAKQKPCLTDYATPASFVSAFCRATLQRLIPRAFFGVGEGGASNQRIVMEQVDRFIRMSRFESLSLHEVCRDLQVCSVRAPHEEKVLMV
jgi:telomerase reverse transcriptase